MLFCILTCSLHGVCVSPKTGAGGCRHEFVSEETVLRLLDWCSDTHPRALTHACLRRSLYSEAQRVFPWKNLANRQSSEWASFVNTFTTITPVKNQGWLDVCRTMFDALEDDFPEEATPHLFRKALDSMIFACTKDTISGGEPELIPHLLIALGLLRGNLKMVAMTKAGDA